MMKHEKYFLRVKGRGLTSIINVPPQRNHFLIAFEGRQSGGGLKNNAKERRYLRGNSRALGRIFRAQYRKNTKVCETQDYFYAP